MKWAGYVWASPITLVGLMLAALCGMSGGEIRRRGCVVEASGGWLKWLLRGGAAMALGHVILARDEQCLDRSRKHELAHVRQFERWGIFLLPAYWSIGLWLRLRGYHPYLDHPLEPPVGSD